MIKIGYLRLPDIREGGSFDWKTKHKANKQINTSGVSQESYPDFYATIGRLEGILFFLGTLPSASDITVSIDEGKAVVDGSIRLADRRDEGPARMRLLELEEVASQIAYGFTGSFTVTFTFRQEAYAREPDGQLVPLE